MPAALQTLPPLSAQAERLIDRGAHAIGGFSAAELRTAAGRIDSDAALLVLHPDHAPASRLAPLVEHDGKHGFAVVDMTDVDDFSRIASVTLPAGPVYIWSRSSIAAITWPTGAPTRRCRRSSPPDGLPHPQRRPPLATPAARGT